MASWRGCERRDLTGRHNSRKQEAMRYFSIESAGALIVSLFINVFIMAVFAKGFFGKDIPDIGLANAGHYLGKSFGTPVVRACAVLRSPVAGDCMYTADASTTGQSLHRRMRTPALFVEFRQATWVHLPACGCAEWVQVAYEGTAHETLR